MTRSEQRAVAVAERLAQPVVDALRSAHKASLRNRGTATLHYLMRTEVHTYAFSVAANAILAFFPFIVLLMTLTRKVFRSPAMNDVVVQLLRDFLPAGQDFIVRNLSVLVNARKGVQVASLLILLFTSSGVFLPLEVALNRVWGIQKNRSYFANQLVSLGLSFAVGLLALLSIALTAGNHLLIDAAFGDHTITQRVLSTIVTRVFAIAASIAIFFLIYWLLPNAKIPARAVLPAAFAAGILWEAAKYIYIALLPWLDFQEVYGPFALSVTLMFWAFVSGMLLLAGAFLSADPARQAELQRD
jgi:membrane protein